MSSRFGRRARLNKEAQEMNITAFMNLMVVLTPFLLITAVFSRMSIIELNLPSGGPPPQAASQTFELEVVVHKDRIDVADRNSGLLAAYPRTDGEYDYAALREKLKTIKAQFPELTAATILLEPDTPYEIVVQTMDTVRTFPAQRGASMVQAELFPEISVGDAPP
ncbi:MAG: biopolymer transporter ExbD [Steroidobacteraceae bacterium]|jgi:biopolymer transport protein ExbD|nr:biopolymer transporter ExbD [Steroidobacteraceae bacterium]